MPEETFRELIYDESARAPIKERWPEADIRDASDDIHEGRFEVFLKGVTEMDFYVFALSEGFILNCLGFLFKVQDDPKLEEEVIAAFESRNLKGSRSRLKV